MIKCTYSRFGDITCSPDSTPALKLLKYRLVRVAQYRKKQDRIDEALPEKRPIYFAATYANIITVNLARIIHE